MDLKKTTEAPTTSLDNGFPLNTGPHHNDSSHLTSGPRGVTDLLKVALVGHPNVGKSSLYNYLTRTRDALVKNEPGVTRDIKEGLAHWWGHDFLVFDTGGITDAQDLLLSLVKKRVTQSLSSMDIIILIFDGKHGLSPEDHTLLQIVKKTQKPFITVINKLDRFENKDLLMCEFYELGIDSFIPISIEKQINIDHLVEHILNSSKQKSIKQYEPLTEDTHTEPIRISIVGKPNVGKSSLINKILGEDKQLVWDLPGTTIDANDHSFSKGNQSYTLVDTAGLRKSAKRQKGIESLAAIKSYKAIDSSDIVLLIVDATEGPTQQDAKITEYLSEVYKTVILVFNKSDLAKKNHQDYKKQLTEKLSQEFHFFRDIRHVFISAQTGQGLQDLFRKIEVTWKDLNIKIPTSQLNQFFVQTIKKAPSPTYRSLNVKFYYLTQTGQRPPSFIAFANYPEGVTPSYRRFLVNRIKQHWNILGLPIRIFTIKRKRT